MIHVTGCSILSSFPAPSAESLRAWQARKSDLIQLQTWQFVGRVIVNTEDDSWSGIIYWDQHLDAYQIDFKTPLGQSMLQLQGDEDSAVLKLANEKEYRADDAETLIYNKLGWGLPVKTLVSWVTGMPSPAEDYEFMLDEQGRLIKLKQSDWDIQFKRYAQTDKLELPRIIFMESDALNIRLVIDKWVM
ncbi:MAG: outer membrane lipoprotein LolB [Gammaproteobacteria bacterium]|nr:outer membrane lipoprotein LolB [Gammaproteobacteria bacterium]